MTIIQRPLIETILDLTCTIQQIPAPTFHEEKRAAFVEAYFRTQKMSDVHIDSTGNVLARFPGGAGRPLVVSAHMDTVHPLETRLGLHRHADRIIGPSIGDNSLGLAAVMGLARLLSASQIDLPGDVWLVGNVGEEGLGNLKGIQAIVDRFGSQPIAYLVVEGMGLGNILHRGLGVERYKISIHTPGGHSWVDYGQPSAIHELCALVTQITGLILPQQPCTTLNVGVIHGGTTVNSIAAHAWLELDLRSEDSTTLTHLVADVQEIVRAANQQKVRATMEQIGRRQAGAISARHPLVELAARTLVNLGLEPHLDIASTDANFPLSRGYPAICIGITQGNNAHSHEEYIMTDSVMAGMTQLFSIVLHAWETLS